MTEWEFVSLNSNKDYTATLQIFHLQ